MPVVFQQQISATKQLGIWDITETLDELLNLFPGKGAGLEIPKTGKRQLEFLCSRLLLDRLAGEGAYTRLAYDSYGKPFLSGTEQVKISFSHSHRFVAAIAGTDGEEVGIDIEQLKERIAGLAKKFVNEHDSTHLSDTEALHLLWGAKETIYKIYGKKELDFRQHMTVKFDRTEGTGYLHTPTTNLEIPLSYFVFEGYMLVLSR